MKRIPLLFEVRDLWPESAIETGVLKNKFLIRISYRFEKFMYRHARLINVLTPSFREKLIGEKKVDPEKIIMIPNAADFTLADEVMNGFDRKAFRKEQDFGDNLVCTYVGAHGVANHLEQVLQACELLLNEPVLFVLIGDGMQKRQLIKKAGEMKLTNIRFYDSVSKQEALKYIAASDAGISVLKKAETFKTVWSNKTFDYMACKKPILMAIDGQSRQLVVDAMAGFYIEPENPLDFAAKVKMYLSQPELLQQHGMNGYLYAKQHFDRQKLAAEYLRAVEDIAMPPRPKSDNKTGRFN
jgi:glycosyltransferase involved in cell wall biosynthesis